MKLTTLPALPAKSSAKDAIRSHLFGAAIGIGLLGGTATAWSLVAPLEGAVVAAGSVVVETNIKKVQHPTGGVVGQLNVREGQRVTEGDVVVRLDETVVRANLGIVLNDLTGQRLRQSRLVAERDGKPVLIVPADIAVRASADAEIASVIVGERQMLETRLVTKNGQKAQLTERVGQSRQEMKGLEDQRKATEVQLRVAREEYAVLIPLYKKGLVQKPRMTALEREVARSEGALGELIARNSQALGKISETELQILQIDKDQASEVAKDLRETETKIGELTERRVSAEDQLKRIDIRAPISGTVHQLNVHTVGGVINQTEPLMLIVPEADRLIVEVRINQQDIDQVRSGQTTRVRFSAFNQRTTPEVNGTLLRVAGDITKEQQTGQMYYTAAVHFSADEMAKLKGLRLIPGMPAEAYIITGERTLANYLIKPLADQMQRGLRER
jgi:HlyD family secretion protein